MSTQDTHIATDRPWPNEQKGTAPLKLDRHGLPHVPQPSDHPDDPLNWSLWKKWYIVILVSTLAFVSQLGSSLINPAYVNMSADLKITVQQASYCTTVYILFSGVTPMFIAPLANLYGRRVLYVTFTLVAIAANVGSGAAASYGGVITGRVFNGIGSSIPVGFGAATVCDLFTQGERGLALGFYALLITNAPHISPICGGYIAQSLSWRWDFYFPAIFQSVFWILAIFTLPETLFSRDDFSRLEKKTTYASRMFYLGRVLDRRLTPRDFWKPFYMIKYVAVFLPCLYYCTLNTYGSALFAVTGAHIFTEVYGFSTGQVGLIMGIPLTIGCMLGEASAGWLLDQLINRYAKRHGGYRKSEVRLWLLPLCITTNVGIIMYGVFIQQAQPWIAPAVAMAIAGYGLQLGTSTIYIYTTDSYKPQSAEVGAIVNLFRQIFAFTIGFQGLPACSTLGYGGAFGLFSSINFLTMIPVFWLIFRGESIRERQGIPNIHQDL